MKNTGLQAGMRTRRNSTSLSENILRQSEPMDERLEHSFPDVLILVEGHRKTLRAPVNVRMASPGDDRKNAVILSAYLYTLAFLYH